MSTTIPARTVPEHALPGSREAEIAAQPNLASAAQPTWPRRILVATAGSRSSNNGILAARVLADRSGAAVEIAAVYSPHIAVPTSATRHGLEQCEAPERTEAAMLLQAVRKQCRESTHARRGWPLRLEVGDPGSVIVRLTRDSGADLVVLGIGCQEPAHRWGGGHTSVRVARYLTVPLLASASGCEAPVSCVVALPNGLEHVPTVRAAIACLPAGSHVWIALPRPASAMTGDALQAQTAHEIVSRACGRNLQSDVDHLELERVDIEGDMLSGVLRLAEDVRAQLIAVPNRGDPGPIRAYLPNLAEPLLLAARCSVLVVPDQLTASSRLEARRI